MDILKFQPHPPIYLASTSVPLSPGHDPIMSRSVRIGLNKCQILYTFSWYCTSKFCINFHRAFMANESVLSKSFFKLWWKLEPSFGIEEIGHHKEKRCWSPHSGAFVCLEEVDYHIEKRCWSPHSGAFICLINQAFKLTCRHNYFWQVRVSLLAQ